MIATQVQFMIVTGLTSAGADSESGGTALVLDFGGSVGDGSLCS